MPLVRPTKILRWTTTNALDAMTGETGFVVQHRDDTPWHPPDG